MAKRSNVSVQMAGSRRPDIRPGVTGSQSGPQTRAAGGRAAPNGRTKKGYIRAMPRPKK